MNEQWKQQGLCRDEDPAIFFPSSVEETTTAKEICAACPVSEDCLQFALVTRQQYGVWGGKDMERDKIIRRRLK
jgi:WhiB family redox-sensing transcriptional regulator